MSKVITFPNRKTTPKPDHENEKGCLISRDFWLRS